MKIQIEQAVLEHFRKHELLKEKGVKVLTLFFIEHLRKFFEDSYNRFKTKFNDFKNIDVGHVHDGYFSKMQIEKAIEKDRDIFDLILKNKERLLSFEEPVPVHILPFCTKRRMGQS